MKLFVFADLDFVVLYAFCFFFFNDTAPTEIYTLSLHDALPISTATHLIVRWDALPRPGAWPSCCASMSRIFAESSRARARKPCSRSTGETSQPSQALSSPFQARTRPDPRSSGFRADHVNQQITESQVVREPAFPRGGTLVMQAQKTRSWSDKLTGIIS